MGLQKHQLRGGVYYKFLTLGILSIFSASFLHTSGASALGGFSLPGFEDWQAPWVNWNVSQVNYNITDGAGNGAIAIKKVDERGNPLANAKFKIDGVTALYVNGKYIYSTELGLYSEFTTDENGQAIVSGLPFGTYKVTETAAPEGYELNPQTYEVVVSEDNMAEVEYRRKTWTIDMYGLDLTQNVATDPSGQLFLINDERGIFGLSIDLEYNSDEGRYEGRNGEVTVRKLDGDYYEISTYSGAPLYLQKSKLNESLYSASIRLSETGEVSTDDYYIKENGDGSITGSFGGDEVMCTDGVTSDCAVPNSDMYFRKVGDSYCVYASYDDKEFFVGFVLEYDPEFGAYILNPVMYAAYLNVGQGNTAYLYLGTAMNYYQIVDKYVLLSSGTGVFDDVEEISDTVPAVSLTITNSPSASTDEGAEEIVNPATGDVAVKVFVIAVAGLAPLFILRKQLTKRSN